jgi:hypothetical protein
MAWGLFAVYVCRCFVMLAVIKWHLMISFSEILNAIFPALIVSLAVMASVLASVHFSTQYVGSQAALLAIGILAGAVSLPSTCWLMGKRLIPGGLVNALQEFRGRRSTRIQRITTRFFDSSNGGSQ